MKKGWKIFAIICGALAGVGAIMCVISLILGFSWTKFQEENPYGIGIVRKNLVIAEHDYDWEDSWIEEDGDDRTERSDSDENHAEILSGDFEKTFSNAGSISVELSAGEMEIKSYDGDEVKLVGENISEKMKVRCYMDGNTMEFRTSSKIWKANHIAAEDAGKFTLYLPESIKLDEVEIRVGAGELTVKGMEAYELDLHVGVGEASLKDIYVGESSINCGVGNITIEGEILGDIDIECGVGEISMSLLGEAEDYNYEISKGIGALTIDGKSYKDIKREVEENNGAESTIEISGGIGEIEINFR